MGNQSLILFMDENTPAAAKTIVLIEDEQIILDLLVRKLESAGYRVQTAMDGESGLALIHSAKPDLVLLDMMLPKLDGFGVLEKLHAEKMMPTLPVVIISNSGQPIEIERALKLGVRDYLIKVNFDPKDVLVKVQAVFAAPNIMPAATPKRPSSAAPHTSLSPTRILLVEDDVLLVQLLERKLTQQQYDIHQASDVEHARQILKENEVDIILLDIVLPGTDGFTFLAELKANSQWKEIPVIIMSNLGQQEEIERGLKGGAADYVIKAHSTPQEIVDKIETTLIKK